MEFLEGKGAFFWRNNSAGLFDSQIMKYRKKGKYEMRGTADILMLVRGMFVAIEVKSEKGRLSVYQICYQDKVRDNGGLYWVVRREEDIISFWETFCV